LKNLAVYGKPKVRRSAGVIVTSMAAAMRRMGIRRVRKSPRACFISFVKLPSPRSEFMAAYPRLTPIDIERSIAGTSNTP
jgi:hypothetical protein